MFMNILYLIVDNLVYALKLRAKYYKKQSRR